MLKVTLVVAIVVTMYGVETWGLVGMIPGAVLWVIVMVSAISIERIKRRNDVYTYREILAFGKGEPIERDPHAVDRNAGSVRRVLKVLVYMVCGALVGGFRYMLVSTLMG